MLSSTLEANSVLLVCGDVCEGPLLHVTGWVPHKHEVAREDGRAGVASVQHGGESAAAAMRAIGLLGTAKQRGKGVHAKQVERGAHVHGLLAVAHSGVSPILQTNGSADDASL